MNRRRRKGRSLVEIQTMPRRLWRRCLRGIAWSIHGHSGLLIRHHELMTFYIASLSYLEVMPFYVVCWKDAIRVLQLAFLHPYYCCFFLTHVPNLSACSLYAAFTYYLRFGQVQSILDQNRLLINEINQNHESKIPDNLTRNVGLIRELNNNIRRVVDLYTDLSSSFTKSMEALSEGESAGVTKSDGRVGPGVVTPIAPLCQQGNDTTEPRSRCANNNSSRGKSGADCYLGHGGSTPSLFNGTPTILSLLLFPGCHLIRKKIVRLHMPALYLQCLVYQEIIEAEYLQATANRISDPLNQ
ncbi:hypothetical protein ACS0TY_013986 [Phlomoides rotata]